MIRNEVFDGSGVCVEAEVIDLAAGTVTLERDGKAVEARPLTAEEVEVYTPQPSPDDRIAALEATNAALLADLAQAATLAAVRAAAQAAAG